MSTKTTFKRIALVAVAALGLGVLSVAPSSAAVSNQTFTVTNGTATQTVSDSTTAAVINVSGLISTGGAALGATGASGDTVTVGFLQKSIPSTALAASLPKMALVETNTAATQSIYSANGGGTGAGLVTQVAGANKYVLDNSESTTAGVARTEGFSITRATAGYYGAKFILQLDSVTAPTAGTYTYTVVVSTYSVPAAGGTYTVTQATQDVSIVVAAAATASTTVDPTKSVGFMNAGTSTTVGTSDAVVSAVSTASAIAVATIPVRTYNAASGAAAESVTATITGAGTICAGGICGTSLALTGITDGTGATNITVLANGTAGVGTVNISTTTTKFSPKTITFYSKAAKTITAAVASPVLKVGANDSAVSVTAVDANGVNWAGTAYIVASAAADALIGGSATTPVACTYVSSKALFWCPVTAIATGTAKFKVIDASTVALATATSNEISVTVSNATAASVKLEFDKATYQPYEKAIIKVTVLDAAGSALAGQAFTNVFATGGIATNIAFSGTAVDTTSKDATIEAVAGTDKFAGSKTFVVYMPAQGNVTISATGGTLFPAAGQVKVSATASVVNSSVDAATDAANEATDAANAATDAALAAADAADAATAAAQDASDAVAALSATVATLVASLKAQITSLTNLVIKIQKKVKA